MTRVQSERLPIVSRILWRRVVGVLCGGVLLLSGRAEPARGDDAPKTFIGSAGKTILESLKDGNGWSVVSARDKMELIPGAGVQECVKYRVVSKYQTRKTDDGELVVDVEYYPETDWIDSQFKLPQVSGPSITAAKGANMVIGVIDTLITATESAEAEGELAKQKPLILKALRRQRAALATLVQQDVASVGKINN